MGSDIEMVRIKSNSTGGPKGRPLNKPNYNSEAIMNEFIEALSEYFNISYDDREPVRLAGTPTLNSAAEEFGITALKARKLLITANYYSTATSRLIAELSRQSLTISQIMTATSLSRASVHSYLPYKKGAYNLKELSTNAERTKLYRERKKAVEDLRKMCRGGGTVDAAVNTQLWDTLLLFQDYPFHTAENSKFTYYIKDGEIFVSHKEQPIVRSFVLMALEKAVDLGDSSVETINPDTCGTSYLWPVFRRIGVLK